MSRAMNSGIRGGLWTAKHYAAMGDAVWLFGWLVHRQTTQRLGEGLVFRGKPLTYGWIAAEMSDGGKEVSERTVRRWMARLRETGYIEVKYSVYSRLVIRVLNAKKFNDKQLGFPQGFQQTSRPEVADIAARSGHLKEGSEIEQKKIKPYGSPSEFVLQKQLRMAQREYIKTDGGNGAKRAVDEIRAQLARTKDADSLKDAVSEFRALAAQR